jgi:homoserine kinase type II
MSRLPGRSVLAPDCSHCAPIGVLLAELHLAAKPFGESIENPRGLAWCQETGERLAARLPEKERALLQEELRFQAGYSFKDLPRGICHCDAFRDNVLFIESSEAGTPQVSGIIDFYLAGDDALLFDLAVVANDWCLSGDGNLDPDRTRTLLQAYDAVRPLEDAEQTAWPATLRRAALRFWLSRLRDFHSQRSGLITYTKDPAVFGGLLRRQIAAGSNQPWR